MFKKNIIKVTLNDPEWYWLVYMVQIEAPSNLEFQGVPSQHGQHREEHRVGPNRSPKYPWVSAYCPPCSKWTIKMCLCDHESPVGNPLHNSKFKFRACPYRPRRSSLNFYQQPLPNIFVRFVQVRLISSERNFQIKIVNTGLWQQEHDIVILH